MEIAYLVLELLVLAAELSDALAHLLELLFLLEATLLSRFTILLEPTKLIKRCLTDVITPLTFCRGGGPNPRRWCPQESYERCPCPWRLRCYCRLLLIRWCRPASRRPVFRENFLISYLQASPCTP